MWPGFCVFIIDGDIWVCFQLFHIECWQLSCFFFWFLSCYLTMLGFQNDDFLLVSQNWASIWLAQNTIWQAASWKPTWAIRDDQACPVVRVISRLIVQMLESVTLNVITTQPFTVCYKLYVSMTWIRLDDSKGKTGRSFKNKLDGHHLNFQNFL